MFAMIHHNQILRTIVATIPVDVMDVFSFEKRSLQNLFHDIAVCEPLLAVHSDGSIASAINRYLLPFIIACSRAVFPPTQSGRRVDERFFACGAYEGTLIGTRTRFANYRLKSLRFSACNGGEVQASSRTILPLVWFCQIPGSRGKDASAMSACQSNIRRSPARPTAIDALSGFEESAPSLERCAASSALDGHLGSDRGRAQSRCIDGLNAFGRAVFSFAAFNIGCASGKIRIAKFAFAGN
jgi:hypothetical protein